MLSNLTDNFYTNKELKKLLELSKDRDKWINGSVIFTNIRKKLLLCNDNNSIEYNILSFAELVSKIIFNQVSEPSYDKNSGWRLGAKLMDIQNCLSGRETEMTEVWKIYWGETEK